MKRRSCSMHTRSFLAGCWTSARSYLAEWSVVTASINARPQPIMFLPYQLLDLGPIPSRCYLRGRSSGHVGLWGFSSSRIMPYRWYVGPQPQLQLTQSSLKRYWTDLLVVGKWIERFSNCCYNCYLTPTSVVARGSGYLSLWDFSSSGPHVPLVTCWASMIFVASSDIAVRTPVVKAISTGSIVLVSEQTYWRFRCLLY